MAKHHKKHHHHAEGLKLLGSQEELISLLITDEDENIWAIDQLVNEGPKHKQVLNAVLLNRLYKLVQVIEKNTDSIFTMQKGYEWEVVQKNEKFLPIPLPLNLLPTVDKKIVADNISEAPRHVALMYALILQVTEWSIKAVAKK